MTNSANAWLVGVWRNAYEGVTAGANTTFRNSDTSVPMGDTNGAQAAGSHSITAHDPTAARDWSGLGLSIAPLQVASGHFLSLLGVGT